MSNIKLVSESLQEWEKETLNEEQIKKLNESAKGLLQKFIENPEKKERLTGAFARQLGKVKGLKNALLKLNNESQVKLAQQALKALEDPKKTYPWCKIENGKITGGSALGSSGSFSTTGG